MAFSCLTSVRRKLDWALVVRRAFSLHLQANSSFLSLCRYRPALQTERDAIRNLIRAHSRGLKYIQGKVSSASFHSLRIVARRKRAFFSPYSSTLLAQKLFQCLRSVRATRHVPSSASAFLGRYDQGKSCISPHPRREEERKAIFTKDLFHPKVETDRTNA